MATVAQNAVIKAACEVLKNEPWYRGVCVDRMPSDDECAEDFNACVQRIVDDTTRLDSTGYWADECPEDEAR